MFRYLLNQYYPNKSKLHTIHPLIKMISLILFLITVSMIHDFIGLTIVTVLLVIAIYLSKVPVVQYVKVIKSLTSIIVFMILITILFRNSIPLTLLSLGKVMVSILYTNVILFTTRSSEVVYGLELLCKPLKYVKINPNQVAITISLALRFIPNIFMEIDKIMKSQASRGVDFKYEKWDGKLKAISSMIVPVLYLSLKRADDVADAMMVRSYDYNAKRTRYHHYHIGKYDKMILIIHIVLGLFIVMGVLLK